MTHACWRARWSAVEGTITSRGTPGRFRRTDGGEQHEELEGRDAG